MSLWHSQNGGKPVMVEPTTMLTKRVSTGYCPPLPSRICKRFSFNLCPSIVRDHRTLPRDLAEDIQQFGVSEFAKRYFSRHRTGLIFKRRVPVEELMVWQKVRCVIDVLRSS